MPDESVSRLASQWKCCYSAIQLGRDLMAKQLSSAQSQVGHLKTLLSESERQCFLTSFWKHASSTASTAGSLIVVATDQGAARHAVRGYNSCMRSSVLTGCQIVNLHRELHTDTGCATLQALVWTPTHHGQPSHTAV